MTPSEALDKLYELDDNQGTYWAIEWLDDTFSDGRYDDVDAFLAGCDVTKLKASPLYGILTISRYEPEKTPSRADFIIRAEAHIRMLLNDDVRVDNLLKNVRGRFLQPDGTRLGF